MTRLLDDARVGYFASIGPRSAPHLVPICFARVGQVLYSSVDTKPKSSRRLQRVANIEASPAASLLVSHYVDDWTRLWWVRVDGAARVVAEGTEHDAAVAALAAKYAQYAAEPPVGPTLALGIGRVSGWSASGENPAHE